MKRATACSTVCHQTIYDYVQPVSVSHHIVRLTPAIFAGRDGEPGNLSFWPLPPFPATTHIDYFGNTVTSFTLPESHTRMTRRGHQRIGSACNRPPHFSESPAWETVRDTVPYDHSHEAWKLPVCLRFFRVSAKPELAAYASESFPSDRPLLEAAFDLTARIHQDFRFDPKATEVTTPVETFSKSAAAFVRTSPTCRSPACAPWGFRRVMSAVTCARSLRPAVPAWWARRLPRLVFGLVPRLWLGRF